MLDKFKDFLQDEQGWDMYITGRAGTGKTTGLAKLIEHCQQEDIDYTVCAFTHKACGILAYSLPDGAKIRTLHSFLKKRPTINAEALSHKHIETSQKHGDTDKAAILFVDEYSMVGEQDLMDIRDAQDSEAKVPLKVVWLGDPHQLPPVGDAQSVRPYGKYQVTLTKVYRQAEDNPLMTPLNELVSFIEGAEPTPLTESESLIRQQDILEWYDNDRMAEDFDGVMLAYTNKRVQELNKGAQGYEYPIEGCKVFNVSNREYYTFENTVPKAFITQIERPFGDPLVLGSKYKTLEYLLQNVQYDWVELTDEDGEAYIFCSVFGHYDYKVVKDSLTKAAAKANQAIATEFKGVKPAQWAKQNSEHPLAKARAKAWREFLAFNQNVVCLDFAHAMTVHKSQGSTYKSVYLDTEDLAIAADIDYMQYLKLMYVAFSRASKYVVTN